MVVVATVKVKTGSEAVAEALFRRHIDYVRREEPGTVVYALQRARKEPRAFLFYERYADGAAFDRHGKSAAMQSLYRDLTPILDGPPTIEFYDEVDAK